MAQKTIYVVVKENTGNAYGSDKNLKAFCSKNEAQAYLEKLQKKEIFRYFRIDKIKLECGEDDG